MQNKSIFPHFKKAYKLHVAVWLLYVAYELIVVSISLGSFQFINPNLIMYYVINVVLFYSNAELIFKVIGRYWLYPIIIISEVLLYSVILFSLERLFILFEIIPSTRIIKFDSVFLSRTIWRGLFFIGFSIGFVYIIRALEEAKKSAQLEKQNLINTLDNHRLENELVKLENNYLRSQINPHFLFNTLSFIYNGTRKAAPEAASAILSLSEMMRYALKQPGSSELIYLRDEVEQVQNLMNLHTLRTKNKVFVELDIPNDITEIKFLPLVLLTLAENIYKHGNISKVDFPAKISIINNEDKLTICTLNLKADRNHGESNGVGMGNIKRRLETFYKENLEFNFTDGPNNTYLTEIIITKS